LRCQVGYAAVLLASIYNVYYGVPQIVVNGVVDQKAAVKSGNCKKTEYATSEGQLYR
jgi:hypothetical protein